MAAIDRIYQTLDHEVQQYRVPIVDLIQVQRGDPFHVLIATILSARTNDATTAAVCERLFKTVNSFDDLDRLTVEQIAKLIYPVGFYHTKAKHLKQLPSTIRERFHGRIPDSVDELIELPGVGRKTANLVVAVAFDKPAICVDVHVHRIMNRLGYVETKTPLETEMALRQKLPVKYWKGINRILVAFGQFLCRPITPKCSICPVYDLCERNGVTRHA